MQRSIDVTDPDNVTVLDTLGIASTGWLYPLTFVAHQDGVYTMHFSNTLGGNFKKAVTISYRTTRSLFWVPVEHILLLAIAAIIAIILALLFTASIVRNGVPAWASTD